MKKILLISFHFFYFNSFAQTSKEKLEQNTSILLRLLDTLRKEFDTTYKILSIEAEDIYFNDERFDKFAAKNRMALTISSDSRKRLKIHRQVGCIYIKAFKVPDTCSMYIQFCQTVFNEVSGEFVGYKITSALPLTQTWIYEKTSKMLKRVWTQGSLLVLLLLS